MDVYATHFLILQLFADLGLVLFCILAVMYLRVTFRTSLPKETLTMDKVKIGFKTIFLVLPLSTALPSNAIALPFFVAFIALGIKVLRS